MSDDISQHTLKTNEDICAPLSDGDSFCALFSRYLFICFSSFQHSLSFTTVLLVVVLSIVWLSLARSLFMINFRIVLCFLFFLDRICVFFYWFVCNFLFKFINHLIVDQLYTIYFSFLLLLLLLPLLLSICVSGMKTKTVCVWKNKMGI